MGKQKVFDKLFFVLCHIQQLFTHSERKPNYLLGSAIAVAIILLIIALSVDRIKVSKSGNGMTRYEFVHGFKSFRIKGRGTKVKKDWGSKWSQKWTGDFSSSMQSRGIAWIVFGISSGITAIAALVIGVIMENQRCSTKALAGMLILSAALLALGCACMLDIEYPDRKTEGKIEWGASWIMAMIDVGILFITGTILYLVDLESS